MYFVSRTNSKALSLFKGDERKVTKWIGAEGVTETEYKNLLHNLRMHSLLPPPFRSPCSLHSSPLKGDSAFK